MIHELKTDAIPFEAIAVGDKRAEFRKNDRDFMVGDVLKLWEWVRYPGTRAYRYSGRYIVARITHVQHGGKYGIRAGYAMLSIALDTVGTTTGTPGAR